MTSKWITAFAVLGILVVFASGGILALDAASTSTTETRSGNFSDTSPPVVETGEQLTGSIAGTVPYLAFVAVPAGILGILTIGGLAMRQSRSGGYNRY